MPKPPDSQQLWQAHPDGEYAQAVAVVPTVAGLPVALSDTQATLLSQLDNQLGQLLTLFRNSGGDSIFDLVDATGLAVAQSSTLVAETRQTLDQIKALLVTPDTVSVAARLATISGNLADSEALLALIEARLRTPVVSANAALNGGVAALNAVTGAAISSAIALTTRTKTLLIQPYFSNSTATAALSAEFRGATGTTLLSRRWLRSSTATATTVSLSGQFAGDAIALPADGASEVIIHARSVSTGNLTVFVSEVSDV